MTGLRRHRRLTLAGSITGAVIVALDGTVLTVAQPALRRDLHASFSQVQWTSTGYLIAVAGLLVFAGRLGDRYGHQRVFALGSLGFGAASAGIGLASGIGWVIALRVAQGVFGALLQPATLGMLRTAYPPDRLGMPIALRTSAIGLAAAAGPVVGGALAAHWGWRAVFLLNVVPALAIGGLALTVRLPAPTSRTAGTAGNRRHSSAQALGLPGACLLAVTLVCLVHTLVVVPEHGWSAATVLGAAAAAVACGAFIRHERRTTSPLIPPSALGRGPVVPALLALLTASAAMFGTLFLATYYLQDVLGLDPLQCGLRVLPLAAMMVLSAPLSAVLQRRYGPRRTATAATVLLTAGILVLSRLGGSAATWSLVAGFLLLGAGFGTVMVTATDAIVRHVPAGNAGVAGGLQQTAMNTGPTLGVAAAAMLTTLTSTTGAALMALAALAVLGVPAARRLPDRTLPARERPASRTGNSTPVPGSYPQEDASGTTLGATPLPSATCVQDSPSSAAERVPEPERER
ncbi:MFS transporter [Streptomyces sp. NPDC001339]|uniref:MFS transporter n=1 Tax=Streptomyces sp. NPDC001339 TaxID=3364563 RepID=UPI0036A6830E